MHRSSPGLCGQCEWAKLGCNHIYFALLWPRGPIINARQICSSTAWGYALVAKPQFSVSIRSCARQDSAQNWGAKPRAGPQIPPGSPLIPGPLFAYDIKTAKEPGQPTLMYFIQPVYNKIPLSSVSTTSVTSGGTPISTNQVWAQAIRVP